ncbi:MAG: alpha-L-arabinofuranosidase C-terminal domain-containing protein [Bacteroidota bacterium]
MITFNYPAQILKKWAIACSITLFSVTVMAQNARIVVDASRVMNKIPAKLYGSCIEDVNHEIYGGLYDQRLYGESFEEPAPTDQIIGWKPLEGNWKVTNGTVTVNSGAGYKLIKETPIVKDGSIEADVKFGNAAQIAGLILRVSNAQNGMDEFDGYEISLAPGRQMLVLGKHVHNFKLLKEAKINFDKNNWTHLKVGLKGNQISIYVNNDNTPALVYADDSNPLLAGKVGLRTFNAAVSFKDVIIKQNSNTIRNVFIGKESLPVSGVWDAIKTATVNGNFSLDNTHAYNGKQAQVITYTNGTGKMGVANNGLNRWGIAVRQGQKFQGYVFLKADQLTGPVTVALQNADGTKTYASQQISGIKPNWTKYPFTLTANATNVKARFVIYIEKKGKLEVDQAMLMSTGKDQFKGLPIRADIATKMQQEGLNFVRYGGTMVNATDYKWNNMTGPADKRAPYNGHWYPYTSNGFGIEEFVAYCNAAGFEGAFAINVEEKPEDVADMVEYLTGSATTTWGKKRAENGHPAPYKLNYIELGNEEVIWGDLPNDYKHYGERFNLLYDAIHAKNPDIKVICAAWWRPKSEANMELVFKAVNGKADYWDLHTDADEANAGKVVDRNLQFMKDQFLKWDPNTKLKITIFEENGGLHNMQRALGHATTLNAVRRHGDFVLTSCAANGLQALGQNDNGWDQGQVFFTPSQAWGMPPFYATQMAAKNHQPLRVYDSVEGDLDVTATRSEKGDELVLHVVNTKATATKTSIALTGFTTGRSPIKVYTLSGDPKAENTPQKPEQVITKEATLQLTGSTMEYNFPANSYTILRITK